MKKTQFKILKKDQMLQMLGGITDPNLDPDAGYVIPAKDPVPSDEPEDPVDEDPSHPRTRPTS